MEQTQEQQASASPSRNTNPPPRSFTRCHARNRDGSQCRLHAQDLSTGLCNRHAHRATKITDRLDDSIDLSPDVFAVRDAYENTECINAILSNVISLVAQGRMSPRRAAVITYALSLMLRSVVFMDRQAAEVPTPIIFNAPRPNRDDEPSVTPNPGPAATTTVPATSINTQPPPKPASYDWYSRPKT
jgi:hypothetical protein